MKVLYYSLVIIIIDQITKFIVKGIKIPFIGIQTKGISYHNPLEIIDGFLNLTKVENYGIAFGFEFGKKFRLVLLIVTFTIIILMFLYLYIIKKKSFGLRLSLSLILAGAVGNFIDRVFYGVIFDYAPLFKGKVVDFIQIKIFEVSFLGKTIDSLPVFNIADISIFIGTFLLFYFSLKENKTKTQTPEGEIEKSENI